MGKKTQHDRSLGDAAGAGDRGTDRAQNESDKHSGRTAGTNRDFDETQESDNQGHGHPREERSRNSRD